MAAAPVDVTVVASGVVEILLGLALLVLGRWRVAVGWIVAAFFVAILPGNIEQFVRGTDAFGLDSGLRPRHRSALPALLVLWALWSTACVEGLAWPTTGSGRGLTPTSSGDRSMSGCRGVRLFRCLDAPRSARLERRLAGGSARRF